MDKKKSKKKGSSNTLHEVLSLYTLIGDLKKQVQEITISKGSDEERISDLEVHINLLTRLITTLCIEKFGFRVHTLRRLVKRIEKEALRDSQIHELESLYQLPTQEPKKKIAQSKEEPPEDPLRKIT